MVVRRPCDVRARKQITEQGRVPVTLIGSELSLFFFFFFFGVA